jgi:maltose alpha-D-glucosyltransferase/alpha-amylase
MKFFGDGDECRAAYHFPLMPRFWQALAEESPERLLAEEVPPLLAFCSWFTFLRVHDEVTLDVLPTTNGWRWCGRWRERTSGCSGRQCVLGPPLDILGRNPDRAVAAFALLHTLPGTPVLYYGDEAAMVDNEEYFRSTAARTGFPDSRFLHRGPFDAARAEQAAADPASPEGRVYKAVGELFRLRAAEPALFAVRPELSAEGSVMVSARRLGGRSLTIRTNLGGKSAVSGDRTLRPYEAVWELI